MKTLKDVIFIVVLFAASLAMLMTLYGCGTIRGIGEDLGNLGSYEARY